MELEGDKLWSFFSWYLWLWFLYSQWQGFRQISNWVIWVTICPTYLSALLLWLSLQAFALSRAKPKKLRQGMSLNKTLCLLLQKILSEGNCFIRRKQNLWLVKCVTVFEAMGMGVWHEDWNLHRETLPAKIQWSLCQMASYFGLLKMGPKGLPCRLINLPWAIRIFGRSFITWSVLQIDVTLHK